MQKQKIIFMLSFIAAQASMAGGYVYFPNDAKYLDDIRNAQKTMNCEHMRTEIRCINADDSDKPSVENGNYQDDGDGPKAQPANYQKEDDNSDSGQYDI